MYKQVALKAEDWPEQRREQVGRRQRVRQESVVVDVAAWSARYDAEETHSSTSLVESR